jgi:RecB family endonuclease NucS
MMDRLSDMGSDQSKRNAERKRSQKRLPAKIESRFVEKALRDIDENGFEPRSRNHTFKLIHDGKEYPPLAVLAKALEFQTNHHFPPGSLRGEDRSREFKLLRNAGFTVARINTERGERIEGATVEEPTEFAREAHLEEFLVKNWASTKLGDKYDIYTIDGETVGQQFQADGLDRMDILAISKDRTRFLVIELKKGRASDQVVGQLLRYMGYVQCEMLESGQSVEGAIIASTDNDLRLKRALSTQPNVKFYRYCMRFDLMEQN